MNAHEPRRPRGGIAHVRSCPSCDKTFAWIVLVLVLLGQASCRAKRERPPVVPVTGEVFSRGQPAAGATVTLIRLDEPFADSPHGVVDAEGAFRISTYQRDDGAPPGDYAVTIVWRGPNPRANGEGDEDAAGPDRLAGRYANPQASPWRMTVGHEAVRLERFEIE